MRPSTTRCFADGNAAALAPTSAMICGIDAKAGDLGEALHRVVVGREQVGHLLIELGELVFDEAQFVERELH